MAKVRYVDRTGKTINKEEYQAFKADPAYTTLRQYDNGAVRVKLLWIGRVVNPHLQFFDSFKVFGLEVMNYTSDGTLAPDPIYGDQTFSREDAALKAYETFLTKWADCLVDEDGDFMETGNKMEAPKSANPNTPESLPDAPELGGIGAW